MSYPKNREEVLYVYNKHVAPKVNVVQNASKHTLKELLQRALEHTPYIQLYELKREKTLLSGLPISNKFQKVGRKLQVIPQTGGLYSIIFDGRQILAQAKANIIHIFTEHEIPEHISKEIGLAMIWIVLGAGIYYGLTKSGDAIAYKQKFFSKNINSGDD